MKLLEKIQKELTRLGITQKDFEAHAQIPQNRLSKWKSGQGEPTSRQLLRMARVLRLPMEFLADDSQDDPQLPYGLTEDEVAVLRFYRQKRAKGELDESDAISGMAGAARAKVGASGAPVVLTGQAAKDAIAASQPTGEVPQVIITQRSRLSESRKKA